MTDDMANIVIQSRTSVTQVPQQNRSFSDMGKASRSFLDRGMSNRYMFNEGLPRANISTVIKCQTTENIGYIFRRLKYILLKTILTDQRLKRKEDQVADNIYGFATSGNNVTSLILPLYSDVQKRVRFALCNKYMPVRYSV